MSLVLILAATSARAQPAVVATAEGQIGEMPGFADQVFGPTFESIRGQAGEILLGGIFVSGGVLPPPPEFAFLTDGIHGVPNPVEVGATETAFQTALMITPSSFRSRNAADDGDFVAFSFAVDGSMPQTISVRIATFDETGNSLINLPVTEVETFPDPTVQSTGVAVDDQGRVTVAYTDLTQTPNLTFNVKARRFNAVTGLPIGSEFSVTPEGRAGADIALLDPAGNRLIIATTDFTSGMIRGNLIDTSGGIPVVLPEFPISTTPAAFGNNSAAVAANPATGDFFVAWENVTANAGDPINIRGRRFDAMGNPIGGDFEVNSTTANTQGQPAAAYSSTGASMVVWAGDTSSVVDVLDIFGQVYDADGNPIGGEIKINTVSPGAQDNPVVRFLPDRDAQGRPQVAVVWRDSVDTSGTMPRGTGVSYRCFSIDGLSPSEIFADGFESGDTTSWSSSNP